MRFDESGFSEVPRQAGTGLSGGWRGLSVDVFSLSSGGGRMKEAVAHQDGTLFDACRMPGFVVLPQK